MGITTETFHNMLRFSSLT